MQDQLAQCAQDQISEEPADGENDRKHRAGLFEAPACPQE